MGKIVFKDPVVVIDGVTLSTSVRQATISTRGEVPEATASGDAWRKFLGGLKSWSVQLEFYADEGATQVGVTLFPLLATETTLAIKGVNAATSPTNPNFTGSAILTDFQPFGAGVGDTVMAPATFQGSGALTRAEA